MTITKNSNNYNNNNNNGNSNCNKIKMTPEHTPAPSPGRAVYGFCLFLLVNTLFIIYVCWAFIPTNILEDKLGLTYLPDKYFALYLPILILCATTIFAFFIYPSLNLSMTSDIDNECTIRDKYTIYRCQFIDIEGQNCENKAIMTFDKGWKINKYCEFHEIYINNKKSMNDIKNDDIITDMCDCTNENKHNCLLNKNLNHVKYLKTKPKVPTIRDLDLAEVCEKMFDR